MWNIHGKIVIYVFLNVSFLIKKGKPKLIFMGRFLELDLN